MKLLLELLSLVEDTRADVESLLYRAIKKITGKRVTIRKRGSFLVDFVIDGSHDRNGADDFEVHRIVTELKKDSSLPFTVEETFKSKHIGISTGFNVFLKAAGDKKGHQLFHVEIKKQPITRDSADGNPRVDYEIVRLPPDTGNGIKNELLLVHHVSRFLESANKPITIVFQDRRGKTLRVENVTRVKHVGSHNRKADVELITVDNHAVKISIKQQNFLEIDAGLNLTRQHRDKIFFSHSGRLG